LRNTNPILQDAIFLKERAPLGSLIVTKDSSLRKTFGLMLLGFFSFLSLWIWNGQFVYPWPASLFIELTAIGVLGCILSLALVYRMRGLGFLGAISFALFLGMLIALVCSFVGGRLEGFLVLGVLISYFTLLSQIILYHSGWISFSQKIKRLGISIFLSLLFYLILRKLLLSFDVSIPSLFRWGGIPLVWAILMSWISLQFHYYDLRNLERALQMKLQKNFEWMLSVGLFMSWAWIPMGILKLLTQARR
jgi:uncharacterized YccA/Bax inhibitor family protein